VDERQGVLTMGLPNREPLACVRLGPSRGSAHEVKGYSKVAVQIELAALAAAFAAASDAAFAAASAAAFDAASAAAYGAQGSGGVIIITTKSGSAPVNNPAVTTYRKSAYNYFIEKKIELNIFGLDYKLIASGIIKEEQDSSIVVRKKTILKSTISRVEIKPE
jgi:hypothetical protein